MDEHILGQSTSDAVIRGSQSTYLGTMNKASSDKISKDMSMIRSLFRVNPMTPTWFVSNCSSRIDLRKADPELKFLLMPVSVLLARGA